MSPGETLEVAIRLAFTRYRRLAASDCVLQLEEEIALPRAVADAIAEELLRSPCVRSLEIVHGSAGARFVASLLSLRAPNVDVIVTEPRAEPRLRGTPIAPPDRCTWSDAVEGPRPVAVVVPDDCELGEGLRAAFAEILRRRLEAVALLLPPAREIESDVIDAVAGVSPPQFCRRSLPSARTHALRSRSQASPVIGSISLRPGSPS
jgi:hypothetical protein